MGAAYTTFFNGWKSLGGTLFVNFNLTSSYSQWGYWGALENILQTSTPRYDALTGFISANPCWWNGCSSTSGTSTPTALPPSTADTTPPSAPTGLTATGVSDTQVNLAWTASTDNVGISGYKVFSNGAQIGTTPNTSYQVTGLSGGAAYSYTVAAYDAAGNTSAQSSSVAITMSVAPSVTISSPNNGAVIKGNGSVNIAVSANSAASLTITADGNTLATCPNATSCSAMWQGKKISQGTHIIGGIASGQNGQASKSVTITALR
jgi:chitodextrinase